MQGPRPPGTWTGPAPAQAYGALRPGQRYEIREAFRDYDGVEHPAGESWVFLGSSFLPYDDGLSLFVSLDGRDEWHIRLQDRPEEQAAIVRRLGDHVVAIATAEQPPVATLPDARDWHLSVRLRGWRWFAVYAGYGLVAGAVAGAVIAALALPDSQVESGAMRALAVGASILLFALPFAAIGLALGWRTRRSVLWQMLATALPPGTPSDAVTALLGEPNAGRIEIFSTGAAATTWVYRPAVHAGLGYRGHLAIDLGADNRVVALRRL